MSNQQKYFPLIILGITRTTQKEKIFLNFRPKLQRKNNYLVWKKVKSWNQQWQPEGENYKKQCCPKWVPCKWRVCNIQTISLYSSPAFWPF